MTTNIKYVTRAIGRIKGGISASATTIPLFPGEGIPFYEALTTYAVLYLTITNSQRDIEIVKVTAISGDDLTVVRAQEGTSAQAWSTGAIINQRLTAGMLSSLVQKEAYRTYAGDPNGIITGDYVGEELLQTALAVGSYVWWKNITGTVWQQIAGIYQGVLLAGDTAGKIYRSVDLGVTWDDLGQLDAHTFVRDFVMRSDGICLVGVASTGNVYSSDDFGATWTDEGQLAGENAVNQLADFGSGVMMAGTSTNAHAVRSTDYGDNWTDLGQQQGNSSFLSLTYFENDIGMACTFGANSYRNIRTVNAGANWSLVAGANGMDLHNLIYLGSGAAIAGGLSSGKIFTSADYGASWTDQGQPSVLTDSIYAMISLGGSTLLASADNDENKIIKSEDGGSTWSDIVHLFPSTFYIISDLVYIGNGIVIGTSNNSGHVYRSTDYGETWADLGQVSAGTIDALAWV